VAEIIAKLGLDDSKFERGLQGADRKATGILGLLKRKFSGVDLFKDTLRSLGVGVGVGAVFNRVTEFFRHGAEQAENMADHTQAMVDIQRTLQGALGGPRRELELQVKAYNELNRDIESQKALLESLKNPVLEILSSDYQAQVDKAQAKLNELEQKQASIGAGAKAAAHAENLRAAALQRQMTHANNLANIELRHGVELQKFDERRRALIEEYNALQKEGALPAALQENRNRQAALEKERQIFVRNQAEKMEDLKREQRLNDELTKAELRDASEIEKKQIRLNGLRREYETIVKRFGILSNEAQANRNQQDALAGDIRVSQQAARRALGSALVSAGELSTGGQVGRRTEGQRIGDRGQRYLDQAREAVRKGKSPAEILRLTNLAERDLAKAGARNERSMSLLSPEQRELVGGSAVKILGQIRDSLKPVKTNAGGAK